MKTLPLLSLLALALGACRTDPGDPPASGAAPGAGTSAPTATAASAAESPAPGSWREFVKPPDAELRARLSPLAYRVTQEEGTERPFTSELNDNKVAGVYVDVVSGEPLFSSRDKFDSGTGWPSFTRPIGEDVLSRDTDYHIGYARTEVRSALADSHLGHVFPDGPEPTGLRYCINGAALRFVPADRLDDAGYGELAPLFE